MKKKVRIVGALTFGQDGKIRGREVGPDGILREFVAAPETVVVLDRAAFVEAGRRGGLAKNKAKREAAQRNGKLGGRPRKK